MRMEGGCRDHVEKPALNDPYPAANWKIHAGEGDKIETTAVSHLMRLFEVAGKALNIIFRRLGR